MAAAAVRTRLQALTDLFDDADLERGMRLITQDERDRLTRLLRRASS